MNILLIGPIYPFRGGIAHYNATLAAALQERGHKVHVISFRRQYPAWLYPGQSDRDPSQVPIVFEAEYLLDPILPCTWFVTARKIRSLQPDLILIHYWTTFWAPPYAAQLFLLRKFKSRIAYLVHNIMPHEANWWDIELSKLALRQAETFIVQNERERLRLLSLLPGVKVVVSKHPTYRPFSDKMIPRFEAKALLGFPAEQPLILFFGFVRAYKGLHCLIDAFGELIHKGTPAHLVVAGEFWEKSDRYYEQIASLGLEEKINVWDRYIPNELAHQLFCATDVLVAPYVGGTQSGVVGLALAYQLSLIVSDYIAAGIEEEYLPRIKIVPAGDSSALAQAISEVLVAQQSCPLPKNQTIEDDWFRLVEKIEEINGK